eukprot:gnl/TRDRNA2_/TRDRNA2_198060_c0_seq1.p1 gnl/TRDRNA2_/TRDRNA2_198060_c0~~gnl/TRDRNA2_/TRDRNA2_198060_c0_seq1.p1  ORF type:complete len:608 (-),score=88.52 gnl/TRDRNA2_/TRDRNA2_198060_c0_seq1:37-1860(-)
MRSATRVLVASKASSPCPEKLASEREGFVDIPPATICPLSQQLMEDPVMCADGHSYERAFIERWLAAGHRKSPTTKETLAHTTLIPNMCLRSMIENVVEQMPQPQREKLRQLREQFALAAREVDTKRSRSQSEYCLGSPATLPNSDLRRSRTSNLDWLYGSPAAHNLKDGYAAASPATNGYAGASPATDRAMTSPVKAQLSFTPLRKHPSSSPAKVTPSPARVQGSPATTLGGRAKVVKGTVLVVEQEVPIFSDTNTYDEIGVVHAGDAVIASKPPEPVVDEDGISYMMVPIEPRGAVDMRALSRLEMKSREGTPASQAAAARVRTINVQAVTRTMEKHLLDADVQRWGCGALMDLAANLGFQTIIGEQGGIESIVAAMNEHPSAPEVQANGCGALGLLAADGSQNQARIAQLGGIRAIVAAMTGHASEPEVQRFGCAALVHAAANCPENRTLIVELGGVEVVIEAMRNQPTVAALQESGCGALGHLAADDAKNQARIGAVGGIEAVVAAMQAHLTSLDVQQRGCGALGLLVAHSPANQAKVDAVGGVGAVVAAMRAHPRSAELQQTGSGALWILCPQQPSTPTRLTTPVNRRSSEPPAAWVASRHW